MGKLVRFVVVFPFATALLLGAGAVGAADVRMSAADVQAARRAAVAAHPPAANEAALEGLPALGALSSELAKREAARVAAKNAKIRVVADAILPPSTPDCGAPKITAVSAAPPIEPGEEIVLNGCFPRGELRLVGQFPQGHIALSIMKWLPNAVQAKVPPELAGVVDQGAKLQVVTTALQLSNEWPIAFRARRELRLVEAATLSTDVNNTPPERLVATILGAVWVRHAAPHGLTAIRAGVDTINVHLANGWRTYKHDFKWYATSNAYVDVPKGYADDATQLRMTAGWAAFDGGAVKYGISVVAVGPVGVPMK